MAVTERGSLPTPTISAPQTGPAQPPPPQPRGSPTISGALSKPLSMRDIIIGAEQQLQAGRLAAMEFALQPQAIQQATLPTLQAPPPLSAEAQRLLNIGSAQQAVAARSIQRWNDRIALSDAQEVFKNMNAGYAQALYAAERWAEMNMPLGDTSLGGGGGRAGGFGGFGGGGDPRGYAFSLGLYNWRIG